MKHIPEIDGLRGVAIASVMAFHLGNFPIGWMGVPLFFVLSGYLITSILLKQRARPLGQYLKEFYWRRTLRIFPLYYVYLLINAVLALLVGLPLSGYGWFISYLGNYRIGDLAPNVPGGVIGHLWTLAVEEQFYLIWPFVIFFIRRLWIISILTLALAPIVREAILQTTSNSYLAIVTLPSCIDMLAAGALVSMSKDRRLLTLMFTVGLTICIWCFSITPYMNFANTPLWAPKAHIMYTGLALLFAPIVANADRLKFLNFMPLAWIGKISYGLYIWHMMAFVAAGKLPLPHWASSIIGIALSIAIAAASWYLFEKKILKLKTKYWGRTDATHAGS